MVRWFAWLIIGVYLIISLPLLLPDRFLPIAWHPLLLAALLLLWPIRSLVTQRSDRQYFPYLALSPIHLPIYCLLCWLPINLWSSVDIYTSWVTVGYLLLGICGYGAIVPLLSILFNNRQDQDRFILTLGSFFTCCGAVLAFCFPFIVVWKPQFRLFYFPIYDYLQSWQLQLSEMVHPNILAGALVITCPITIVMLVWLQQHHKRTAKATTLYHGWFQTGIRSIVLLSVGLQIGAIILSQSRGGYLALALAILVMIVVYWPRLVVLLPLNLILAIIVTYTVGLSSIMEQFSSDGSLGGWSGRLEIWHTTLMAIADFPLTGIGFGTFITVIPLLYPLSFPIESYPHAHNLFLQVAVDLGLPGFIAYIALLINLVVMLIVTLRTAPRQTVMYTFTVGAAGSLAGMLIHGLLDAVTWDTKLSFMPWILFALITQLFLLTQRRRCFHNTDSTQS